MRETNKIKVLVPSVLTFKNVSDAELSAPESQKHRVPILRQNKVEINFN